MTPVDKFAGLTPEVLTSEAADMPGGGAMGCGFALGKLSGVPYDEVPSSWVCDRLRWLRENSRYQVRGVIHIEDDGWFLGCDILDQATGEVIPKAGVEPQFIEGGVAGLSNLAKQVYMMCSRMEDNTIRWMIAEGLTDGGKWWKANMAEKGN